MFSRCNSLLVFLFLVSILLMSCAPNIKDKEGYVKKAITVKIIASKDLNKYNNKAHTVMLVLYELSDPNIFNQLRGDQEGIGKLLEGQQFDSSVLSRKRIIIYPNDKKEEKIDRVEGARYLGIAAGFYKLQGPDNFSRIYELELDESPKMFWTQLDEPKINFEIELGSDGITSPITVQPQK